MNYRNKNALQHAKGQKCQHCATNDGTTVSAHMNGSLSGRGIGMKAHDFLVAFLCAQCHYRYDYKVADESGSLYISELDFLRAMVKTQVVLYGAGKLFK